MPELGDDQQNSLSSVLDMVLSLQSRIRPASDVAGAGTIGKESFVSTRNLETEVLVFFSTGAW